MITSHETAIIQLTDFPLPMYSEDLEKADGFPPELSKLLTLIREADGLLISVNEHNGTVSSFFKNVLDWLSRIEYKFLAEKKVLLMSTSPGKRGGISSYEYTENVLPRFGAEVVSGFTFPSFSENFSVDNNTVANKDLESVIEKAVSSFLKTLS